MLSQDQVEWITGKLENLARANWFAFASTPKLCQQYREDIKASRWIYTPDSATCLYPDCWSTYEGLLRRYPPPQRIKFDCEDIACAHAGWLASQCLGRGKVFIGLVPGMKISHAVCGFKREDGIEVIDPCRWFGMRPTTYDGVFWKEVY